jgi:hypothetical protein
MSHDFSSKSYCTDDESGSADSGLGEGKALMVARRIEAKPKA